MLSFFRPSSEVVKEGRI